MFGSIKPVKEQAEKLEKNHREVSHDLKNIRQKIHPIRAMMENIRGTDEQRSG